METENKTAKTARELVQDLDYSFGELLLNRESIEAIKIELGRVRDEFDNTDQTDMTSMALQFRDMSHTIILLDDLLRYVSKDLKTTFDNGDDIKNQLFEIVVRKNE